MFRLWITACCIALSTGCGLLRTGGSTSNDPEPVGTIKAQGTLEPRNGKAVTGGVTIYQLSSGGFMVRLNGLSAPSETGLVLRVTADSTLVLNVALRSTNGSQNYSVSPNSTNPTWERAVIRSNPNLMDYGEAQF